VLANDKPMIRKQFYIESDQNSLLREQASQYEVSEGQIVRDAISSYVQTPRLPVNLDLGAWERELLFIKSRSQLLEEESRAWKRDELYDR